MASFLEVFGDYIGDAQPPEAVAGSRVARMRLDRTRKELEAELELAAPAAHAALSQLGKELAAALQLQEVRLNPHYPAALFTSDRLPELVSWLGNCGLPVNGFFEDSRCDLVEDKLRIYLSHGGQDFLESIHCAQKIASAIRAEYG